MLGRVGGIWEEIKRNISSAETNIEELKEVLIGIKDDINIKYSKKKAKEINSVISKLEHLLK